MARRSDSGFLGELTAIQRVILPLLRPAARRLSASFLKEENTEENWRKLLTGEDPRFRRFRKAFATLPASDRCKNCCAPFTGLSGAAIRLLGRRRYDRNPRYCTY